MSLMSTSDGMIAEAIFHISCVLVDEMEQPPASERKPMREESADHLMQAIHSLSLSYVRERGIC